jgi:GAF domain-containing protein
MGTGDLFGEMALFEKMPRAASVLAHSEHVSVFALGREAFDTFLAQQGAEGSIILRDVVSLLSHRLREAREELRVVYEISEVVASVDGVVALGDGVLGKLLHDIPEAAAGLMAAWPEFSDDATVVSAKALPADQVDGFSLARRHPLAVELDHRSRPFIVSDVGGDHPLAWMVPGQSGSVLLSPMSANDRLHGFLALSSRPGEHFSAFDVQLMSIVANLVAISFLHALQLQEHAAQERKTRVYYGQVQ